MTPETSPLVPETFGPLQGVKILSSGTIIAQPFAALLAAEMGAEVIQIERPGQGDQVWRNLEFPLEGPEGVKTASAWVQERRNMFHVSLDLSKPRGKELFLQLAARSDIWMESSKPGAYQKWGLDDETVLKANPKLVICHVSGYGQEGHPDYLGRASYDFVGQGFGGMMHLTGFADPEPPVRAVPWTADYITAGFCLWSSLAGYIHAQRTGQGQVIDLAQYEAIHKTLAGTMVAYYEMGLNRGRSGNKAGLFQPYDVFHAKDGWVIIAAVGTPYDRVCGVLGLDPKEEKWQKAHQGVYTPEGLEFDAILRAWAEERTVQQIVDTMNEAQVAACPIMTPEDTARDPHYEMRDMHVEWEDVQLGRKVKGTGVVPKFSETPGKIWRGSVGLGHDNELIFSKLLDLNADEIAALKQEGIT